MKKRPCDPFVIGFAGAQVCLSGGLVRFDFAGGDLAADETCVILVLFDQLLVGALFDEQPLFDDEDAIGVAYGAEAVGNDDLCTAL
jgi:hypothetical protein